MPNLKEQWASTSYKLNDEEPTDSSETNFSETNSEELSIFSSNNVGSQQWREKYLSKNITSCSPDLIVDELGHQGHTNIFQVEQVFSKEYCDELIEEAESSNNWTKKRHDNYPTTDMLLSSFSANTSYENVLRRYLYPMIIDRWRLDGDKWSKLVGENFIIKYESVGQASLELHHDSSEFTILTALNDSFEGGGTWFHNQKLLVKNPVGGIAFHPGNITHLHGGRPVTSGIRYIVVSFCRCEND